MGFPRTPETVENGTATVTFEIPRTRFNVLEMFYFRWDFIPNTKAKFFAFLGILVGDRRRFDSKSYSFKL